MTLTEYYKIPKGEQPDMKVGDRFRPLESQDSAAKVGSVVGFYEVVEIKESTKYIEGYTVQLCYDKIIENPSEKSSRPL